MDREQFLKQVTERASLSSKEQAVVRATAQLPNDDQPLLATAGGMPGRHT
ncbi:MAG TPA: hypothetical protein VGR26_01415 [Acidimicrobiales bacterium]|nr:hypothetical protein [Acidimicrobiales bacterium]